MRDDAARALRVDDEMPRHRAELRSVSSIDDAYADLRARASESGYERTTPRRSVSAATALEEAPAERPRETVSLPRTAPGRSYGAHRRGEGYQPVNRYVAGRQPGRRTVEITGQVQAPRRRSQTSAAFVARPDRTALWAFLLALFLVAMALATAHGGA
jgi:hypothetical protein